MPRINRIIFLCSSIFILNACNEKEGGDLFSYLMLHPEQLNNEMILCQKEAIPSQDPTAKCAIVMKATDKRLAMVEMQQKHPEKFGQQILRAQMDLITANTPANREKVQVMLSVVGQNSPE